MLTTCNLELFQIEGHASFDADSRRVRSGGGKRQLCCARVSISALAARRPSLASRGGIGHEMAVEDFLRRSISRRTALKASSAALLASPLALFEELAVTPVRPAFAASPDD